MVSFALWDISSGSNKNELASVIAQLLSSVVVVVEGAEAGSVVSYWVSSKARSAGRRGLGWSGERRTLYGTGMATGGLRRLGVSFEVDGRVKTRDAVPLTLSSMYALSSLRYRS